MAKTKLTEEQKKEIALLRASNQMLNNTLSETIERGKKDSIPLIKEAIRENEETLKSIDPNIVIDNKEEENGISQLEEGISIDFDSSQDLLTNSEEKKPIQEEVSEKDETIPYIDDSHDVFDISNNDLQYDVIPLPSNGEGYASKISRIPVAYLTAESENLITSPHLYKDDLIIEALLKYHVLAKNINIDDLLQGDVDAIMLWLRATGYGNEYPIIAIDPDTKKEFNTSVDLSTIKMKEFNLKGDENGLFDFHFKACNKDIKFKYLSYRENKKLKLINKLQDNEARISMAKESYKELVNCLNNDASLTASNKKILANNLDNIKQWVMSNGSSTKINKMITNKLEMMIQSVDGNSDKNYIKNFIKKMPARDSLEFRKYIEENEPGVNWRVKAERPESLGGGSVDIFLQWSSDAFLNIA